MRESNIHAGNATFKQLRWDVLLGTKRQYMKESKIHAGNVKQIQSHIVLGTKLEYMKKSNTIN